MWLSVGVIVTLMVVTQPGCTLKVLDNVRTADFSPAAETFANAAAETPERLAAATERIAEKLMPSASQPAHMANTIGTALRDASKEAGESAVRCFIIYGVVSIVTTGLGVCAVVFAVVRIFTRLVDRLHRSVPTPSVPPAAGASGVARTGAPDFDTGIDPTKGT